MPALSISAPDAQPAPLADAGLGPCDGRGHPGIVEGTFLEQQGDGGVDSLGFVFAAGETLADLGFGQLPPPEHPEGVDIGLSEIHSWFFWR